MKTKLPDARKFPRFAGIPTFCRFPLIDTLDSPPDWAVFGAPFDGGTTYRPGARFGPRAIRERSAYVKPFHLEHGINLAEKLSVCDAGDAPVVPFSCIRTIESICEFGLTLGDARTKLFAVGGDHSIALANVRATHRRHGGGKPLALLHFDSHLDTVDSLWGEKYSHASPFIRAIEEGIVDPKRMVSIGLKGPLNLGTDLDFARGKGVDIISFADWRHHGGASRFRAALDTFRKSRTPVYLTFDVDVIDPAFAPGTGTPSVGGFTSAEALDLLREARGVNIVGADVVEVLPDCDPGGVTAYLAAHLIFEILCLTA